ncbi:relaxase/mobilization nuclease domain-containing protein [Cereibacter azotoformans]|uniref:Toprim domain-containing protein n=1 Tax=Cereibacter azotoformans TaxID=43057 RepID=A0A2T5JSZ0_9RHOB|nr:relaxase/mobilization nuclease domain-containing protein [Cereibacter azotoformans]PTR12947.1 Toprim domain-containing protein [Cereibacter azotoformans]UIJ32743.1 relaxase/mobilization nuclease domain-containing protein [Cereibacter azotoformans]
MICEIIQVPGEPGSGAGPDAFKPGIDYVCSKASRIELRNLESRDWREAAREMRLTAELSEKVRKPYYHLVLSWHEHEQPTDDQQVEAMDHLIRSLGLEEHQAVIGTHRDTRRCHIHAVINTVHPLTEKVWSKSKDHEKAELACRQIELDQGWSHDRGHFDLVVVVTEGRRVARLLPKPAAHWDKVRTDREAGRRPKTSAEIRTEKRTGFETFDHSLPDPLKAKVRAAVEGSADWPTLHLALRELGLRYQPFGSGARVHLIGSTEYAKASSFGSWFSLSRMEKRLGPHVPAIADPEPDADAHLDHPVPAGPIGLEGAPSPEDEKATRAEAFKVTLLRRLYVNIHVDPRIAREIRFVALNARPPRIAFRDGVTVRDHGPELTTSASTRAARATMIAMAKAKGWTTVVPSGEDADYIRQMSLEAAAAGLRVMGVPPEVQAEADRIYARWQATRPMIDHHAEAARQAHLEDQADREAAVRDNAAARKHVADQKREVSAEAQAVIDVIGPGREPAASEKRRMVREVRDRLLANLSKAMPAPKPKPAPDAAKTDPAGARRIQRQLRENDARELDDLKRLDIGMVAAAGGWSDVSATHPDSSDRQGRRFRIYQRGGDTIKCTLTKAGHWLWTSNKSGRAGSVFDLWRLDNPGRTLGHARAALRELAGTTPVSALAERPVPAAPADPEDHDHTAARQRWEQASMIRGAATYAEVRGIARSTLDRFATELRCGPFAGILFAHRNLETGDIQGFEQRWERDGAKNQARFAKGGRKSLCVLGDLRSSTRMVVCEGGLDALAVAEIENRADTIYVSTGGGFGPETVRALARLAEGRRVFGAFDADVAGETLHARLVTIVPSARRLAPRGQVAGSSRICKDWLEVLNATKGTRPLHPPADSPSHPSQAPLSAPTPDDLPSLGWN